MHKPISIIITVTGKLSHDLQLAKCNEAIEQSCPRTQTWWH